jgi:hypothetical protein
MALKSKQYLRRDRDKAVDQQINYIRMLLGGSTPIPSLNNMFELSNSWQIQCQGQWVAEFSRLYYGAHRQKVDRRMQHVTPRSIRKHIKHLQSHLARENPILLEVVKSFRALDSVCLSLGVQKSNESLTTQVPWWPMIAVLGTFSSGKSTFINSYLGDTLQLTGNQAVDDRFTVICYAGDDQSHTLPGRALDADPRFPFFQMSRQIEDVAKGEGSRIDSYLQLKTTGCEKLRGKIMIDSPGFDADEQRNATLRITDHIIDLSDLVLVFFDARHPEPGAMQDTLEHLVANTINRPDSSKFLYILNQIDNAAREDNPEEVFAAWQRALAGKGLTAGRFYTIYNPSAAVPIENPKLRERFERKRDEDMAIIEARLDQVEVERAYRIIGVLENTAKNIQEQLVPSLREYRERWKRLTLWLDGLIFGLLLIVGLGWGISSEYWQGFSFNHPLITSMTVTPLSWGLFLGGIGLIAFSIHMCFRQVAAESIAQKISKDFKDNDLGEWLLRAFRHNTRRRYFMFGKEPIGYRYFVKRRLAQVLNDADGYIQSLNNRFADPSGSPVSAKPKPPETRPAPDISVVKKLPVSQGQ